MWNKDQQQGTIDETKGKVKQAVGSLTGDENLKAEGEVDEAVGKLHTAVGDAKEKAGKAIEKVAEFVKK